MEKQFLNAVILRGIVGRATVKSFGPDNHKAVNFSLITQTVYPSKDGHVVDCTWFNVTCFEGSALNDVNQIQKGSKVEVIGRMRAQRYTAESGEERIIWGVIAQRVTVLEEQVTLIDENSKQRLEGLTVWRREADLLFMKEVSRLIAELLDSVNVKKLEFREYVENCWEDACFSFDPWMNRYAKAAPFISVSNSGTIAEPNLTFEALDSDGEVTESSPIDYLDNDIERLSELYKYIREMLDDPEWNHGEGGIVHRT